MERWQLGEASVLVQIECVTWLLININMLLIGLRPHPPFLFLFPLHTFFLLESGSAMTWVTTCSQRNYPDFTSNVISPVCPLQRHLLGILSWSLAPRSKSRNPKDQKSFQHRPPKSSLDGLRSPIIKWSKVSRAISASPSTMTELQKRPRGTRNSSLMSGHNFFSVRSRANFLLDHKCRWYQHGMFFVPCVCFPR